MNEICISVGDMERDFHMEKGNALELQIDIGCFFILGEDIWIGKL